jgi:uncharacterized protein
VAIKVTDAYNRRLDFERVPAENAEPVYLQLQRRYPVSPVGRKLLEDHLFWYIVEKATQYQLPVKMHTGYHAQWAGKKTNMPLRDVKENPAHICTLCDQAPDTRFVFFHIGYPCYEEMLAVAKQYHNAYMDMCLGHAVIARSGIALALSEFVEENYLSLNEALELAELVMFNNARKLFRLGVDK